ncbi:hypothetical protein CLF_106003 [Clonorchis sinensis]|uniref:Transmembrane protein n=1 Tax=Clonorchis sinensis TaxID=79923 RepID=G7YEI9_CLOSI|nr:hypothetical protein CLF_106003 [Clonorchis sinensis]
MNKPQFLPTILLGFAIALVSLGLLMPYWYCGDLFFKCQEDDIPDYLFGFFFLSFMPSELMFKTSSLLLTGAICLTVVFVLSLMEYFLEAVRANLIWLATRVVLLILGTMSLWSGILLYTTFRTEWSNLVTITGCVLASNVILLTVINSECVLNARFKRTTRMPV